MLQCLSTLNQSLQPPPPYSIMWACTGYATYMEARRKTWVWSSPFHLTSVFLVHTAAYTRLAGLIAFMDSPVSTFLLTRGALGLQVLPWPALHGFSHLHGCSFPTAQLRIFKRLVTQSSFAWSLHLACICRVMILLELLLCI